MKHIIEEILNIKIENITDEENKMIEMLDNTKDYINIKKILKMVKNRLLYNFINIFPIKINNYKETELYKYTIQKNYKKGLTKYDIYNTIIQDLVISILDIKWLIY